MVCVCVFFGINEIEIFLFRVNEKVKINIIHRISTGENIRHLMHTKVFMLSVNVHGNSIEEFSSFGKSTCSILPFDSRLSIRFEMPYNIWCNTCGNHVGMGVRYNAEKTKIGNYFTTPIFQFRMKCHLCDGHYEIKTDPKVS